MGSRWHEPSPPNDSIGQFANTVVAIGVPTIFAGREFSGDDLREYVSRAEDGGASAIVAGDHMNWYNPTLECLTTLGFVASLTTLPLASHVIVAPLRQPFLLAKQAATLATLAPGGFTLGIGVGGEHENEFTAAGVSTSERGARTDEILEIIAGLKDGQVDHVGDYYQVESAKLDPLPPFGLLIGGRSEKALRRTVKYGDAWSGAWVTANRLGRSITRLTELSNELGRKDPPSVLVHVRITMGKDEVSAWTDASTFLTDHYNADPVPMRPYTLCGNADDVIKGLLEFKRAGATELIVTFAGADQGKQLDMFCSDVLEAEEALRGEWPMSVGSSSGSVLAGDHQ